MDRRSFLLGASGAGVLAAAGAAGYRRWQEIAPTIHDPGRAEGHFLRDRRVLPPSSAQIDTDIVILGSGIAGLTAAWKLQKEGHRNFLVIDGPQPYGNAAGTSLGGYACPTGAHYLPLPATEAFHVREILHDLGILLRNPASDKPYYDERFLLHEPQERILFQGRWQEGVLPKEGVPDWELAEQQRFHADMARIHALRGADGRRLFTLPSTLSSMDPAWRSLDRLSFRDWLTQNGFRAPTLHWYADYCCRDDYGASYNKVSAWAGLHYFCSRGGQAENAANGAWLTWPGGLEPLATDLDRAAGNHRRAGTVIALEKAGKGVQALCFELHNGQPRSYLVRARKAICAMPLFVAARVVKNMSGYGFDRARHLPSYAPWMVANFLVKGFPQELPHAPLSWDNVVYGGKGLGYVVSTHQDVRVAPPPKTVLTAYVDLSAQEPLAARRWLQDAHPQDLLELAMSDLVGAYGRRFAGLVERADLTLRAHAMASPSPGFLSNAGLQALRETDGPVLFAHADLSGFSVFEEASWWGYQAALRALS
jgi:hypothetical protein